MRGDAGRFATLGGAIAVIIGLLLLPFVAPQGSVALRWSLAGWLLTTSIGVLGGAWIVAQHGTTGPGFLIAFGVCMLARLTALGIGALVSAGRGGEAVGAYLAGLLVGYLPPQAWEMIWLLRATRHSRGGTRA